MPHAAALESAELIHDDWLDAAGLILSQHRPACVDFLYADPPFNTGHAQASPPNGHKRGRDTAARFDDSFGSAGEFIAWLRPRLEATIPLLKPTGLICLHVDWRTSHHVRVLLDDLLGEDRFVNHLVWEYGLGGSSPRRFARKHDDLLLYCLDPAAYWFDPPRVPATSRRMAGMDKKATDVLRVPSINNMAAERTGYPTQKPLALLELLIAACCPPGGTVLDPCCGSGTTLIAAANVGEGRRAIGFDTNPAAIAIARRRLAAPR